MKLPSIRPFCRGILTLALALCTVCGAARAQTDWTELSPMLTRRSAMSGAALDGHIYAAGGLSESRIFEAFSVKSNVWQPLALLPAGRHHYAAATFGGRIYLFGGGDQLYRPSVNTWSYDPQIDRWKAYTDIPEPRLGAAAVVLNDFIYVVGGTGPTASLLRFDPKRDEWSRLAALNERREQIAAAALDGKIYAIGGRWKPEGTLASVEEYDPKTDRWLSAPPLRYPRSAHAAVTVKGKIYVMGGEVFEAGRTLNQVEVLAPGARTWVEGPALPVSVRGIAAAVLDDQLYAFGGSERVGLTVNTGRMFRLNP
jgi:N-acetylneuraminic acid mutarotase